MCNGSQAKWFVKEDDGKTVKLQCRSCGDFKLVDSIGGKKQ